jgi:hypothetical protein
MEWSYAKAVIVRKMLSRVLAEKVIQGQYDRPMALAVAREILFESPRRLMRMEP